MTPEEQAKALATLNPWGSDWNPPRQNTPENVAHYGTYTGPYDMPYNRTPTAPTSQPAAPPSSQTPSLAGQVAGIAQPAAKAGVGGDGWNEDFDQAWANRMIRQYGVTMEDLRDPGTRQWLNRQQRQKQQQQAVVAPAVKPGTGGVETRPVQTGGPEPRPVGGVNPVYSQPGGAQPGPQVEPPQPTTQPTGYLQSPQIRQGNIFSDPGRARRTPTSAFTLSTNQR